jgi:hypothetical protein
VGERVHVGQHLHPTRRVVEGQQHPREDQQGEEQRLLDHPEHPLVLPGGDGQGVGQRAEAHREHRRHRQAEEDARGLEAEAERDGDGDEDRRLHQGRDDLLGRASEQQRRVPHRRQFAGEVAASPVARGVVAVVATMVVGLVVGIRAVSRDDG